MEKYSLVKGGRPGGMRSVGCVGAGGGGGVLNPQKRDSQTFQTFVRDLSMATFLFSGIICHSLEHSFPKSCNCE